MHLLTILERELLYTSDMNPTVLSGQTSFPVTFTASFLIWLMFSGIVALWLIDGRVKKEEALHALFAALISWGIAQMIKNLFPIARPFEVNNVSPLTLTVPADASFPSGHAAAAFALAVSVWLHNKKLGFLFIISAILVAWGRVVSNVHFLLDVIVGAAIGIFTAYLVERLHLFKMVK